jgi:ubiquinone/menaquinone biosynthesis C-methylase UbiE
MKMNDFETLLMTFDLGRSMYLKGIVRELLTISKLPPGKKILEIGCGNGIGTRLIEETFKPGEFIATEYDESLVDIARSKNPDSKVRVEAGDAANLRFADGDFDAVIGLSVIHHIPNWGDCLDEMQRVIKPGGLLIIKELSIDTFSTPIGRIARRFVEHPYDDMFRKDEFIAYLEGKSFRILDCRPHSMIGLLSDFYLVAERKK